MKQKHWIAIAVLGMMAIVAGILGIGFVVLLLRGGMMGGGFFLPGGMMRGRVPLWGQGSSGGARGMYMLCGLFFCIVIPLGLLLGLVLAFLWMRKRGAPSKETPTQAPPPATGA